MSNSEICFLITSQRYIDLNIRLIVKQLNSDPTANYKILVGIDFNDNIPIPDDEDNIKYMSLSDWKSDVYHVCKAWDEMANYSFNVLKTDMVCFYGTDITLKRDDWYQQICKSFNDISIENNLPSNIGCVVLREERGPNFPSFPIITRYHYELFDGKIFDDEFVNQDADPYLYELYNRLGLARYTDEICICNSIGGVIGGLDHTVGTPEYERRHIEWRTNIINNNINKLIKIGFHEKVSITIATPVHRIGINEFEQTKEKLSLMLNLKIPDDMVVKFVWIIDNPEEFNNPKTKAWFRCIELYDNRVRIRVNDKNRGASYSRTRAWNECHSNWVLYLDDDTVIDENLVIEYYNKIKENDNVAGYVGFSELTYNHSIATNGVHFAQSSFFWHIAKFCDENNIPVSWGVTANIIFKWIPGVEFDLDFPKTGGGEDIQFCIELKDKLGLELRPAPKAKVTHPWWGDGNLLCLHP